MATKRNPTGDKPERAARKPSGSKRKTTEAKAARQRVDRHKRFMTERETARAELAAEDWTPPPGNGSLADELAAGIPEVRYVVEGLMPVGSDALLAAQYKKGKTTAALNLARSLTDGTPLFGAYEVD